MLPKAGIISVQKICISTANNIYNIYFGRIRKEYGKGSGWIIEHNG